MLDYSPRGNFTPPNAELPPHSKPCWSLFEGMNPRRNVEAISGYVYHLTITAERSPQMHGKESDLLLKLMTSHKEISPDQQRIFDFFDQTFATFLRGYKTTCNWGIVKKGKFDPLYTKSELSPFSLCHAPTR